MAAKRVLWEAWGHHFRRTGEACPIPWLQKLFNAPGNVQEEAAQANGLEAATLASLGSKALIPKRPRTKKKAKAGQLSDTEPSHLHAASSSSAAGPSSSAARPSHSAAGLATRALKRKLPAALEKTSARKRKKVQRTAAPCSSASEQKSKKKRDRVKGQTPPALPVLPVQAVLPVPALLLTVTKQTAIHASK